MPRVRRQANFRQLSEFERGRIIGMREAGLSFREIGRRMRRNESTVLRCWRAWSEEGINRRRPGTGPNRTTTEREERRLRRLATRDPFQSSRSVGTEWVREIGRPMSMSSIYRRIRSFGLRSYRPYHRLPLTAQHRAARLQWCLERQGWLDEWNHIIVFSDESRFCLWTHDGRRRVRRPRGQRHNLEFAERRYTGLTPGIMIWGAICFGSRSPLVFIPGSLNARRYVDVVLQPVLLPYIQTLPGATFQQDNARPHIARISTRFMEENDINVLPWPARSPDLSPIEHVWDWMEKNIRNLPNPPNALDELRHQLQVAWDEMPQAEIDHLLSSMPRRINACINVRGDVTPY